MHRKYNTVALLGRDTGLMLLKDCLATHPCLQISAIFTHKQKTKAEGGGIREEWSDYMTFCEHNSINLIALDYPDACSIEHYLPPVNLDILIVLSWKFKVSDPALNRFKIGTINIHRGQLPNYSGLYPVKKAILAGEDKLCITAHKMTSLIDQGEKICEVWKPIRSRNKAEPLEQYVENMKSILKPLYIPLTNLAIASLLC